MRLVHLKQGTEAWLRWRRSKIMASEASTIMEMNDWKTPLDLYQEKILEVEQDQTSYMARGKELEPFALEAFEEENGLSMFPVVVQHESIDWMAASLDGMSIDQSAIVEIKCPGKKDHSAALKGDVPKKYFAQIQHQMYVTGLDFAYYYSFDGNKGVTLKVSRDEEFLKILLEKERAFWHCLAHRIPPK